MGCKKYKYMGYSITKDRPGMLLPYTIKKLGNRRAKTIEEAKTMIAVYGEKK